MPKRSDTTGVDRNHDKRGQATPSNLHFEDLMLSASFAVYYGTHVKRKQATKVKFLDQCLQIANINIICFRGAVGNIIGGVICRRTKGVRQLNMV